MLLYHGTSVDHIDAILQEGIRPKSETGAKGHWDHTVQSHPDLVYLTDIYAPYFSLSASSKKTDIIVFVILEIDLELLNKDRLRPDEDCLSQTQQIMLRKDKSEIDILEWNRMFLKAIDDFAEMWEESLRLLGTCSYRGTIHPEAITRHVKFPFSKNRLLCMAAIDPVISIMNHKLCADKYRQITQAMMGDIDHEELVEKWKKENEELMSSMQKVEKQAQKTIMEEGLKT